MLIKVSQLFAYDSAMPPAFRREIEQAALLIDRIHKVPGPPTERAMIVYADKEYESYFPHSIADDEWGMCDTTSSPPRMLIRSYIGPPWGRYAQYVFVHELGHYIDQHLAGNARAPAHRSAQFEPWYNALIQTDLYERLKRIGQSTSQVDIRRYVNDYLLTPAELWATSYTQFLVDANPNTELEFELQSIVSRVREIPRHWEPGAEDFAAVRREIGGLLELWC